MKVKALVSFGGRVSMYRGETRDLEDGNALRDLLAAGYVEEAEPRPKRTKKGGKPDEGQ